MDLNIGSAFYFASRGKGYLQEHSQEEVSKAYAATIDSRPLLRIGEEGALKSVGLSIDDENLTQSREKFYQSKDDSGLPHEKESCFVPLCKRVSKFGCPRNFCKRCCDRAYREEQVAITNDPTKVYINNCPVHKAKQKQIRAMNKKNNLPNESDSEEEGSRKPKDNITKINEEEALFANVNMKELSSNPKISYQCSCKVLLVGLGADEQMAGYGRHRTSYAKGGWEALCREMNMDLERLWQRNLGR